MTNVSESSIRAAVINGYVIPFAQPIVALGNTRGTPNLSFECLSRLQVDGEILSPANFMSVIGGTTLITRVDELILEQTIRQMAIWKKGLGLSVHMHVNASQTTLSGRSYAAYVEKMLHQYGVEPRLLTIEVLENCHNFWRKKSILRTLVGLTSLFVNVAVDDIGPGWQNLPGLMDWIQSPGRYVPLSVVKIDQSLVQAATSPLPDKTAVLQIMHCCKVAHDCGIGVVAEGIENQSDLILIRQLGCDFVQGYALGRPQSLATTTKTLAQFYRDDFGPGLRTVKGRQSQAALTH